MEAPNNNNPAAGPNPPAPAPNPAPAPAAGDELALGGDGNPNPVSGQPPEENASEGISLDGKPNSGAGEPNPNGDEAADDASYAYQLPDGIQPDPEAQKALTAIAKKHGVGPDKAQALMDVQLDFLHKIQESSAQLLTKTQSEWDAKLKQAVQDPSDQDFHGRTLKDIAESANRGLKHFAPELVKELKGWNLDRNPSMIRLFDRLGRSIRENSSPKGVAPPPKPRSIEDEKAEVLAKAGL